MSKAKNFFGNRRRDASFVAPMKRETERAKRKRLHRQVLFEWRGMTAPRIERPAKALADEVGAALEKLGMKATFSEEDILTAWAQIVPPIIAGNTRPSALRDGVLEISVLQPAIHYTLERQMKGQILKRLQSLFGRRHLKDVRFRLG